MLNDVNVTFDQISEVLPDNQKPWLDRKNIFTIEHENGATTDLTFQLTKDQEFWRDNGFLIKPNFIPHNLIDAYCEEFKRNLNEQERKGGYPTPIPYMQHNSIKDLCLYKPLTDKLKELIGYEMGMHLNLTGWNSTERNWHQDDYLNPPHVSSHYLAVWFALDDIHEDSGPFQYIPCSHKWPLVRRDKVLSFVSPSEAHSPAWPSTTERFVVPAFEEKMRQENLPQKEFIAKKGDVLIWHAGLAHRGSSPKNPDLWRKTIITHYSSLDHRQDMPVRKQWKDQGYYFQL
jgi:hypothetical protein